MDKTRRLLLCAAGTAALSHAGIARSQSEGPLRVILPVGAGSGVDTAVRPIQQSLSRALGGQPVVIDNLPGAGGITGTLQLVKAAPDGRTIAIVSNNHVVNPSVFSKIPFDSLGDITPLMIVGETPFVLVVNPQKLPVRDVAGLVAVLKARPENFNYASSGNGTILQLASEMFLDAAGIRIRHIPYRGVGPMLVDLMSGQVDFGITSVPSVQGQLKSGALRALSVMGESRVASLPDLPTIKEQGYPSATIAGWFAAIGPRGLPTPLVERLHGALVAAWSDPVVKDAMLKQENVLKLTTPEFAAKFFRTEQARYAEIARKAHLKVD